MRTVIARVATAAVVTGAAVAASVSMFAVPALAASHDLRPRSQIVISGTVDVEQEDVVPRVLIFDGDVHVEGRVQHWVFAFNGDVRIDGRVNGDVTSLRGRVVVSESGHVGGDVVSGDPPIIANRASVEGDVVRARDRFVLGRLGAIGRIVLWIAASASSFALGAVLLLVTPRGMEAVARAGRRSVGAAIGLGFAVAIGVPVAAVLVSLSVIGLPLGLATLLALGLLFGFGYVASCHFLGRVILKQPRSPWLAFLVGWAILRVVAIVPILGGLTLAAAVVYGLGCLTVAVFRARSGSGDAPTLTSGVPEASGAAASPPATAIG